MQKKPPIKAGKKYGRLTVLSLHHKRIYNKYWSCKCECGQETVVAGDRLNSGGTKSCGCLQREKVSDAKTKHGFARKHNRHKLYSVWRNMKSRCQNKNVGSYKNYGGRGISVCLEWSNSFVSFATWALKNGWKDCLEIDRIDNDGNYSPENCRFVTTRENQLNTRRSLSSFAKKCRDVGIDDELVRDRLRNGWSPMSAFLEPKRQRKKNGK